ncbi:MAG: hypothetical protein DRJ65_13290 [Acidobacteria bacterium]|nr:MAG: hypothetical protein DRJ65_13290 [Acidobacteriota bacterium]
MDQTKIHTGTRIKLRKIDENVLPEDFLSRVREFSHSEKLIQGVFLFSLQQGEENAQPSMVIAIKSGFFSSGNEEFLNIVDEIQLMLPEDLAINLYRFEASDLVARYCAHSVEPLYLRSNAWIEKQRKKYPEA